jgi:hypothetical protein
MFDKLMPWLILWAIATTGVLVLFVWRLVVVRQEPAGIHIGEGEEHDVEEQQRIAKTLGRIDLWGKTLTVLSVLLIVAIGSIWAWDAWLAPYRSF